MRLLFSITLLIFFQCSRIFADSNSLNLTGRWPNGPSHSVTADSNTAYVGNGALVSIFDISSSESISEIGQIITDGLVEQVEIKDSLLFVFNYDDGFGIYNISNSENPTKLSHIYLANDANQFFKHNDFVYFSADTFGLIILDVSNPNSPTISGTHRISGFSRGIFVKDDIAYVGVREIGIQILDVSNPALILDIGSFQFEEDLYASHFYFANNLLYVTSIPCTFSSISYGHFHILDISNMLSPIELNYFSLPGDWSSYLTSLFVEDSLVYITNATDVGDWLTIINVSDPLNPIGEHSIFTDNPKDVFVQNYRCYLSDGYSGFKVYDWYSVEDDTLIYHYRTNGPSKSIFIKDNYAYVASGYAGLRIVDISDPKNPIIVGLFDDPDQFYLTTSDVAVLDNYAYLVNFSGGFNVLDISNPESIQEIAWLNGSLGKAIFIEDDYAYIANRNNGLYIINISDPQNPTKASSLDASFTGYDVFVNDTLLFLAGGSAGTKVFNVIDPNNPVELITIIPNSYSLGVFMSDDILYVAEGFAGLRLFDISNIKNPNEVGQFYQEGYFVDIKVKTNYGFVADNRFGLRVLNIQKPDSIFEVANYKTDDSAQDIFLSNDLIYLADYNDGFYIFDYKPTFIENSLQHVKQFSLNQNYPNPFNSSTHISFEITKSDFVRILIFDIRGQLIETLTESYYPLGKHRINWNASNYSSGLYFYKIEINDYRETKKCVLIK